MVPCLDAARQRCTEVGVYIRRKESPGLIRRMKYRLGTPAAGTATAHKIARIIFHLLSTREPYDENVFRKLDQATALRAQGRLKKQAAKLGFQIAPIPESSLTEFVS